MGLLDLIFQKEKTLKFDEGVSISTPISTPKQDIAFSPTRRDFEERNIKFPRTEIKAPPKEDVEAYIGEPRVKEKGLIQRAGEFLTKQSPRGESERLQEEYNVPPVLSNILAGTRNIASAGVELGKGALRTGLDFATGLPEIVIPDFKSNPEVEIGTTDDTGYKGLTHYSAKQSKSQRVLDNINKFQQFYQPKLEAGEEPTDVLANFIGQSLPYIVGEEALFAKIPESIVKLAPRLSRFGAGVASDVGITTGAFKALPDEQQTVENYLSQLALGLVGEGIAAALGRFSKAGIAVDAEEAARVAKMSPETQQEFLQYTLENELRRNPAFTGFAKGDEDTRFLFYKPKEKAVEPIQIGEKIEPKADDITESISKAKASGQSFDEWVKGQEYSEFFIGRDALKQKRLTDNYFKNLQSAQKNSDIAKIREKQPDVIQVAEYSKKENAINRAIEQANKLGIKPVVALDNQGRPVIYFHSPVGQISFHLAISDYGNIKGGLPDFVKVRDLENKVLIVNNNVFDGIMDVKGKLKELEVGGDIYSYSSKLRKKPRNFNEYLSKQKEIQKKYYENDRILNNKFIGKDTMTIGEYRKLSENQVNEFLQIREVFDKETKKLDEQYGLSKRDIDQFNRIDEVKKILKTRDQLKAEWEAVDIPTSKPKEKPEIKTRGLAKGIEEKAVEKMLVDSFDDLPEYQTIKIKDQSEKATKLVLEDFEKAKRVAMGEELPPEGLLPESALVAVEKKALEIGDVETLRKLATSSNLVDEATTMGQRLRVLAERNPESAVANIQKVAKDRVSAFEKKSRMKSSQAKKSVITEIKEKIRKGVPTRQDWNSFIDNITC